MGNTATNKLFIMIEYKKALVGPLNFFSIPINVAAL